MNLTEKQIKKRIEKEKSIVIVGHRNPDGDSISSSLGLAIFLKEKYPQKNIYCISSSPKYIKDMFPSPDEVDDDTFFKSLLIIVDVSDLDRVEDKRAMEHKNIICFDHHIENKKPPFLVLRDTSFISCSLLIFDFLIRKYSHMNKKIATYFYIGLITDSGRFLFDSSKKTFSLAKKLISYGVDYLPIYRQLYKKSASQLKFEGYVYSHYDVYKNITYLKMSKEEMEKNNFDFEMVSSSVNLLSDIDDRDIWVFFVEEEDHIKVELRSSRRDVQKVAIKFNGGGHKKASGCKIESFMKVQDVLDALLESEVI